MSVSATSGDKKSQKLLHEEQVQFNNNFALQTNQAMADNENATVTAVAQSHAQEAASSTAGERELGEANAKIVA